MVYTPFTVKYNEIISIEGRRLLAACYAYLGRKDEARFQASKVMEAYPNFSLSHWEHVQPDVNPEDTEHFLHGLRLAGLK